MGESPDKGYKLPGPLKPGQKRRPTIANLYSGLVKQDHGLQDTRSLIAIIDKFCQTDIEFDIYQHSLDQRKLRKELHDAIKKIKKVVFSLSRRHDSDLLIPQLDFIEDIIDLPDGMEERKHALARQARDAILFLDAFPLVPDLLGFNGRPLVNEEILMVARAVRYYLVHVENRDFGLPRARSGPPQIEWDNGAKTLLGSIFKLLRVSLPVSLERLIEQAYRAPLLEAPAPDASVNPAADKAIAASMRKQT